MIQERSARRACGLLLLLACGSAAERAEAQADECRDRPSGVSVVDLTVWDDSEGAGRIETVIRELLDVLSVRVCTDPPRNVAPAEIIDPPMTMRPALARVWVTRSGDRAAIYIVDEPWQRVVIRHVPLRDDVDEVAVEEIGHVVHGTTEALLSGQRIGVIGTEVDLGESEAATNEPRDAPELAASDTSDAPASDPEPPSPTEAAPKAVGFELAARYAVRASGLEPPVHHELGLAALLYKRFGDLRGVVRISAAYRFGETIAEEPVELRVSGGRALLGVGLDVPLFGSTTFRAAINGGVEVDQVDSESAPGASVMARPSQTVVRPIASADVALQVQVNVLLLAFGIGLGIDLTDVRYTVAEAGDNTGVADPWLLRPALFVEVGVAP